MVFVIKDTKVCLVNVDGEKIKKHGKAILIYSNLDLYGHNGFYDKHCARKASPKDYSRNRFTVLTKDLINVPTQQETEDIIKIALTAGKSMHEKDGQLILRALIPSPFGGSVFGAREWGFLPSGGGVGFLTDPSVNGFFFRDGKEITRKTLQSEVMRGVGQSEADDIEKEWRKMNAASSSETVEYVFYFEKLIVHWEP